MFCQSCRPARRVPTLGTYPGALTAHPPNTRNHRIKRKSVTHTSSQKNDYPKWKYPFWAQDPQSVVIKIPILGKHKRTHGPLKHEESSWSIQPHKSNLDLSGQPEHTQGIRFRVESNSSNQITQNKQEITLGIYFDSQ